MTDRVLVMCPSRRRESLLRNMQESLFLTSTKADLAVYLDDDDASQALGLGPRPMVTVGPRIGQAAALNYLVKRHPGYLAYGLMVDDSQFLTAGWDDWVISAAEAAPSGIGVMSPYTEGSPVERRMAVPWATAGWIQATGRFCPTTAHHYYWDIALELMGEATSIQYATEKEFLVRHFGVCYGKEGGDKDFETGIGVMAYYSGVDAMALAVWIALERREEIAKIKSCIGRGKACPTH